jgi:type VI secretion system secreted protein VgrG
MYQEIGREEVIRQGFGSWVGFSPSKPTNDGDEEIIEQGFVLLEHGISPPQGYLYDLYSDGSLHTHSSSYSSEGMTAGVGGQTDLKLVTWIARDSASKEI